MDLKERPPGEDVRRHPWEIARARSYRRLIAAHADVADGPPRARHRRRRRLVRHATSGATSRPAASIVCWDVNYRSEDLATPTGSGITRTAVQPDGPFDIVLALDVLEHIDDDEPFLADVIVPALAPGAVGAAQRARPSPAVLRPRPDAGARPALPADASSAASSPATSTS